MIRNFYSPILKKQKCIQQYQPKSRFPVVFDTGIDDDLRSLADISIIPFREFFQVNVQSAQVEDSTTWFVV